MLIFNKRLSVIKSNTFIKNSFELAFEIIKKNNFHKFINGPISKKCFLKKKYLGITEYISNKFLTKNTCMLIYNKKLAVCPITTHLPLKLVSKKITGPFSADTIFLKNNRKNFDVIVGMYHDQVLTPMKTLYEYDAINITLGLPFYKSIA